MIKSDIVDRVAEITDVPRVKAAVRQLEAEYDAARTDEAFWRELHGYLRDYVGRPSPLYFAERLSHELNRPVTEISEDAMRVLVDHSWPGNVRELENAVERAIVTCRGRVLTEDDFAFLTLAMERRQWAVPANISLQELERLAITVTIQRTQGNIKEAAGILGIDRSTLYEKIKRYEIPRG